MNGTSIETYDTYTMILNFKLRKMFQWTFIAVNVKQPIIGADFLSHYGLNADVSAKKLTEKNQIQMS